MKRMTAVVVPLVLMLGLAPAMASAEVQNDRFGAASAGGTAYSFDPETGTESFTHAEVFERIDEAPEILIYGGERTPLDCGEDKWRYKDWAGFGPSTLEIGSNYSSATARAVVDLAITSVDECTDEVEEIVVEDVTVGFDFLAIGPVGRKREFQSGAVAGSSNQHQQYHEIGREAAGTLLYGDESPSTEFAWIGETFGTLHARPPFDGIRSSYKLAKASSLLNESERIDFVESSWETHGEEDYESRSLGAYQARNGEVVLILEGLDVDYDPVRECEVTTLRFGEATGTLDIDPARFESASARATMDIEVITIDDCEGTADFRLDEGVTITSDVVATGPVTRETKHWAFLIPGETNIVERTQIVSRAGEGPFAIGATTYDGWARLGYAATGEHRS